jgi:hypothetical protein
VPISSMPKCEIIFSYILEERSEVNPSVHSVITMDFESLSALEFEHFDPHRFSSSVCNTLRIFSNQITNQSSTCLLLSTNAHFKIR